MSEANAPPRPDEVEVSLFGPGFGECVLLHLGAGDWLLVDSCVDQLSGQQPALRYLHQLGYDPGAAVKIVVATHWHDDHVRGLAGVCRACPRAEFYCSLALAEPEALVFFGGQARHTYRAGAREFHDVLTVLDERKPPGVVNAITPINWAIGETRIFHRPARDSWPEAEVVALSPSHASVTLAQQALRALMPQRGDPPSDAGWRGPNHNAVVLWVQVGSAVVLLGADLQETGHLQVGWTAIVTSFSRAPAGAFKVPHHGSRNGHHPRVGTCQ